MNSALYNTYAFKIIGTQFNDLVCGFGMISDAVVAHKDQKRRDHCTTVSL